MKENNVDCSSVSQNITSVDFARRKTLGALGTLGLLTGVVSCGGSRGNNAAASSAGNSLSSSTSSSTSSSSATGSCVLIPSETQGPYGPLEELLFPITHGALFFPGMDVLRTHAVYGTGNLSKETVDMELTAWRQRLEQLFDESPIPFRHQNGGQYQRNILAEHIAEGKTGLTIHVDD